MRLIPFLICLLWAGASYGQWDTNIWPSSKTYFDGRKRSIQVYSSLYERVGIALFTTNYFHGQVDYPGFFTQRSSLIEYKDVLKIAIPEFVNFTHTNAAGNFQDYFHDEDIRTNKNYAPYGGSPHDPDDQIRARLPQWTVTGLLAHAGAPTNYLDVTPWFNLNTVSNGWLFLPTIINELYGVAAGHSGEEIGGARWIDGIRTNDAVGITNVLSSPGVAGYTNNPLSALRAGVIGFMGDGNNWGAEPLTPNDICFALVSDVSSNSPNVGFIVRDGGAGRAVIESDRATPVVFATSTGATRDGEHTNYACAIQQYAAAYNPDTPPSTNYYAAVWTNAANPTLIDGFGDVTNLWLYFFREEAIDVGDYSAHVENTGLTNAPDDDIVIPIPIETNSANYTIDFDGLPSVEPNGTTDAWEQRNFPSENNTVLETLVRYNVSNGFKFVHIDGITP